MVVSNLFMVYVSDSRQSAHTGFITVTHCALLVDVVVVYLVVVVITLVVVVMYLAVIIPLVDVVVISLVVVTLVVVIMCLVLVFPLVDVVVVVSLVVVVITLVILVVVILVCVSLFIWCKHEYAHGKCILSNVYFVCLLFEVFIFMCSCLDTWLVIFTNNFFFFL